MARRAALSNRVAPLGCVTLTSTTCPSARMVKVTLMGWVKPALISWAQIIQIFGWTVARYQSPPESVPSGTPGPGAPIASPGVWLEAPGPEPAAAGRIGVFSGFRPFFALSSGSPFVWRGSSFGGFRTFCGCSAGGAGGVSTGRAGGAAGGGGPTAAPPPPGRGPPQAAAPPPRGGRGARQGGSAPDPPRT